MLLKCINREIEQKKKSKRNNSSAENRFKYIFAFFRFLFLSCSAAHRVVANSALLPFIYINGHLCVMWEEETQTCTIRLRLRLIAIARYVMRACNTNGVCTSAFSKEKETKHVLGQVPAKIDMGEDTHDGITHQTDDRKWCDCNRKKSLSRPKKRQKRWLAQEREGDHVTDFMCLCVFFHRHKAGDEFLDFQTLEKQKCTRVKSEFSFRFEAR